MTERPSGAPTLVTHTGGAVECVIRPLNERHPTEKQMTLLAVAAGDVLNQREEEYRLYRCRHTGRLVVKPVRFGREEAA